MGSYETSGSSSRDVLGDLRVRKATLPADGKGRWDGVRQRDKEGAQ